MSFFPPWRNLHRSNLSTPLRIFSGISHLRSFSVVTYPSARNEESLVFPNERHGVDFGTNWAICSTGVTLNERQIAFRNPSFRKCCFLSNKTTDKFDKKNCSILRSTTPTMAYLPPNMDRDKFDYLFSSACTAVSESTSGATFLVDASVGIGSAGGVNIRAVSDDAGTASLLQALLCRVPKKPASQFKPSVQLVHAITPDDIDDETYCAAYGSQVAARGVVEASELVQTIAVAAAANINGDSLLIIGSVYFDTGIKEFVLVIGERVPTDENAVFFFHVIWCPKGLCRVWNFAITTEHQPAVGTIYGAYGMGIVPNGYTGPTLLPHPKTVILSSPDHAGGDISSMLKDASPLGGREEDLSIFNSLVAKSGAKVTLK